MCRFGCVAVIDARGLFDGHVHADAQDDDTVRAIGRVLDKDRRGLGSGVIIVCMAMHERLDESTIKTLVALQNKFGYEIWTHVIIALTKADRFEAEKWLEEKPGKEGKGAYLRQKFEEEVEKRRTMLKDLFTRGNDKAQPDCIIGLTPEQYDEPIMPTSELQKKALKKMDEVGHELWFDQLLVQCCARDNDLGLLAIHTQRMAHLPRKVIDGIKSFIPHEFMERALKETHNTLMQWARDGRESEEVYRRIPSLIIYFAYWNTYVNKIMTSPRFQQILEVKPADEQKPTTT